MSCDRIPVISSPLRKILLEKCWSFSMYLKLGSTVGDMPFDVYAKFQIGTTP